ncbi:MAG: hypothetical protein PVI90_09090, partial [Desulfobacteraceae bacterium]|jgi:hypothetical protein
MQTSDSEIADESASISVEESKEQRPLPEDDRDKTATIETSISKTHKVEASAIETSEESPSLTKDTAEINKNSVADEKEDE